MSPNCAVVLGSFRFSFAETVDAAGAALLVEVVDCAVVMLDCGTKKKLCTAAFQMCELIKASLSCPRQKRDVERNETTFLPW